MVVVRNVFRLKFGQAAQAQQHWKEGLALAKKLGFAPKGTRLLVDQVGTYYTLVFETTHDSLADYEQSAEGILSQPEWKAWYQKVVPLTESGYREILKVVS
jgi:hypothetical protein